MELALILLIVLVGVSAIFFAGMSQPGKKQKSGDTGGDNGAPAPGDRRNGDHSDDAGSDGGGGGD